MSNISGKCISSLFGSGFASSTSSGSNSFNKSRRGISSSNSCNKFIEQLQNPLAKQREFLLNCRIKEILIGIEPIGTKFGHALSYYGKGLRLRLPTYLGGGSFVYHLSCLLNIERMFYSDLTVILEFGAYHGSEPGYKNYIHYVYDTFNEGGLRFSKMTESDYRAKVINDKKGALILENLTIDNKMTLKELIDKCKNNSSWKANDYNLASHNCQDFIAKVIEILNVKRTDKDETKYSHMTGKLFIPPVILNALEKNDTPTIIRVTEQIPVINIAAELAAKIYSKFKKK